MNERLKIRLLLLTIAALIALLAACSSDDDSPTSSSSSGTLEWRQLTSLPTVVAWQKIHGASPTENFVVGDDGYAFSGYGNSWTQIGTTFSYRLFSGVHMFATDTVFVSGVDYGAVQDTSDTTGSTYIDRTILTQFNGFSFEELKHDADLTKTMFDIWGLDDSSVWAAGDDGRLVHYDGDTTEVIAAGDGNVPLNAIWGTSDSNIYVAGSSNAILHFDGTTWKWVNTHHLHSYLDVWGLSDSMVYVTGTDGNILEFTSPDDYSFMSTGVEDNIWSIWGSDPSNLWACGDDGTILHYDGSDWSEQETNTDFTLYSIWGYSETDIYAVGQTALHYDGNTWDFIELQPTPDFYGIWMPSLSEVYLVGSDGAILFSVGGTSYDIHESGTSEHLRAVWGDADATRRFAVGDNGTILMLDVDADTSEWNSMSSGTSENLTGVWGLSDSLIYACGESGGLVRFDGNFWTPETVPAITENLYDIWAGEDSAFYAVGSNGTIYEKPPSPNDWDTAHVFTGVGTLRSVFGFEGGELFAVGDQGIIVHFDILDGWDIMVSPTVEDLEAVWGPSPDSVFAVGAGGTTFYYDGDSWTEQDNPVGVDLHTVFGVTASTVIACGDNNHMIRYSR